MSDLPKQRVAPRNYWQSLLPVHSNPTLLGQATKFLCPDVDLRSDESYDQHRKLALKWVSMMIETTGLIFELPFESCSFAFNVMFKDSASPVVLTLANEHTSMHAWVNNHWIDQQAILITTHDLEKQLATMQNGNPGKSIIVQAMLLAEIHKFMTRSRKTSAFITTHKEMHAAKVMREKLSYYMLTIGDTASNSDGSRGEPLHKWHNRMHAVRGHWRHYEDGRVIFIKPHTRGNADIGTIIKDYRIKESN